MAAAADSELSGSQAAQGAVFKLQYPLEMHIEISFLTGPWILFFHPFGRWCLGTSWTEIFADFSTLHCLPYMWSHPYCLLQKVKSRHIAPDISTQFCNGSPHVVPMCFLDLESPWYTQHCFTRGLKFSMPCPQIMLRKFLLLLVFLFLFSCLHNFPRHFLWDLLHWKKLGMPVGHLVLLADSMAQGECKSGAPPVLTAILTGFPDCHPGTQPCTHTAVTSWGPSPGAFQTTCLAIFSNTFPICGPTESWDFLINFPCYRQQKKEEAWWRVLVTAVPISIPFSSEVSSTASVTAACWLLKCLQGGVHPPLVPYLCIPDLRHWASFLLSSAVSHDHVAFSRPLTFSRPFKEYEISAGMHWHLTQNTCLAWKELRQLTPTMCNNFVPSPDCLLTICPLFQFIYK